jgi:hypothetical protein
MKILNLNISPTTLSTIGLAIVLGIAFSIFYKPLTVTEHAVAVKEVRNPNSSKRGETQSGVPAPGVLPPPSLLGSHEPAAPHKQIKRANETGNAHKP